MLNTFTVIILIVFYFLMTHKMIARSLACSLNIKIKMLIIKKATTSLMPLVPAFSSFLTRSAIAAAAAATACNQVNRVNVIFSPIILSEIKIIMMIGKKKRKKRSEYKLYICAKAIYLSNTK